MNRPSKGFSLIELLVVIAIIAILAAILFPIFTTAKEKGRETTCKSNLKQIGSAIQMYLDDWSGCYPDYTSTGRFTYNETYRQDLGAEWLCFFEHRYMDDTGKAPAGIGKTLQPYVKNLAIFKCPSEWKYSVRKKNNGLVWPESLLKEPGAMTYFYKHALDVYAWDTKGPVKLSSVLYPTKVTIFYEEAWHTCKENPLLWAAPNIMPAKRVMAVFADCHAGYIEIPYINSSVGYDGNWYHYGPNNGKNNPSNSLRDLSKGARDIP